MKRVSIFIGLKVAEISAVVFGPYLLGVLYEKQMKSAGKAISTMFRGMF